MITEEPKRQEYEDSVHAALEHVEAAEHDLERAHELERKAEEELHRAEEELREAEKHRCEKVEVQVTYINDVETVKFDVSLHATIQAVWDESYVKLKVIKHPKDIFQTAGSHPSSLMGYLAMTLAQAREQGVIKDFHFEIVSETGGA